MISQKDLYDMALDRQMYEDIERLDSEETYSTLIRDIFSKNINFEVIKVCGYSENGKLIVYDIHWLRPQGQWALVGQGLERLKVFIKNWYEKANEN